MNCIHINATAGSAHVQWIDAGRTETFVDGHGIAHMRRWFKCANCGAPGFKREVSEIVYTWKPEYMEIVA